LVATKPPSGEPRTEFSPIGSGATTQPIQVTAGVVGLVSISNTSIDSRAAVPDDEQRVHVRRPGCSHSPWVVKPSLGHVRAVRGRPDTLFSSIRFAGRRWDSRAWLTRILDANQVDAPDPA
jgi:hypothetical protein